MEFNFKNLSAESLQQIILNASEELEIRRQDETQKLWDNVVDAIKEYVLFVGHSIYVENNCNGESVQVDDEADFSAIGDIICHY